MISLIQNSNIRRIDELGRIVIPKDIRKKLHIKDSEPLEIYIQDEEIHIKKYSPLPDVLDFIENLIDIASRTTNNEYILTDRDVVLASSDKIFIGKKLNDNIKNIILGCTEVKNEHMNLQIEDVDLECRVNITPIIVDNDRSGILIEYNKEREILTNDIIKIFANLIENRLNNY